jgi:hypothetical protein
MSNNRFTWRGLEELKAALRAMPAELTTEGGHIVEGRANGAVVTIKSGYPSRTSDLRDKLTVEHTRSRFGARSVVRNTSPHALPFELGSQVNRYTRRGWNRGRMPANPIFSQTMRRERRAMYGDLADLLRRHGLQVSGDGG